MPRYTLRKLTVYIVVAGHYLFIYSLWTHSPQYKCPTETANKQHSSPHPLPDDRGPTALLEENGMQRLSNSNFRTELTSKYLQGSGGKAKDRIHTISHKGFPEEQAAKKTGQTNPHLSEKSAIAGEGQRGVKRNPEHAAPKTQNSVTKIRNGHLSQSTNHTVTTRPLNCSGCFTSLFPTLVDQPDVCKVYNKHTIDVVFLITTAITHTAQRDVIRKTWATVTKNNTSNFRHVFVLGTTTDMKRMRAIEEEGRHFRDVIVSSFHDSYGNLTLKTMASLHWVTSHCSQARFFVKVDDDVWVNTPTVLRVLNNHTDFLQHGLGGHCAPSDTVHRHKWKWPVPMEMYPKDKFPPYCYGFGYAGSIALAQKILSVSRDVPFFMLEDVYIGMCLERLGLGVQTFPRFRNFYKKDSCKEAKDSGLSMILNVSPKMLFLFWSGQCPKD